MSSDLSARSIDRLDPQSWNRYAYTLNNPLRYVDPNGKWPTEIHERIIDKAFPKLNADQKAVLKLASKNTDALLNQRQSQSFKHAMRDPKDSVEEAKAKIRDYIDKKVGEAQSKIDDKAGCVYCKFQEPMSSKSLSAFGEALHTVTDRTSPEHTDSKGNPKEWNLGNISEHVAGEATITKEQMDKAVQAAQDLFKQTYGKEIAEQAFEEEKPREEEK